MKIKFSAHTKKLLAAAIKKQRAMIDRISGITDMHVGGSQRAKKHSSSKNTTT